MRSNTEPSNNTPSTLTQPARKRTFSYPTFLFLSLATTKTHWRMYASAFGYHGTSTVRRSTRTVLLPKVLTHPSFRLVSNSDRLGSGRCQRNESFLSCHAHSHSDHNQRLVHRSLGFLYPTRLCATSSSSSSPPDETNDEPNTKNPNKKKKKKKKPKFTINPNDDEIDLDALTAAFDEMAKKEGFDPTTAYYADDATFEDEFTYGDDFDLDGDIPLNALDNDDDDSTNDDYIDFGTDDSSSDDDDMDRRIAEAMQDASSASDAGTQRELAKLGLRPPEPERYTVPDRGPPPPDADGSFQRRNMGRIVSDHTRCSACGSKFQTTDEFVPGYLPQDKYEMQMKVVQLEEAIQLQQKADAMESDVGGDEGGEEWSTEDEIEWLLRSNPTSNNNGNIGTKIDLVAYAQELGLDPSYLDPNTPRPKKPICKRCHTLTHSSTLPLPLRPSPTTTEPTLTQERFRSLLLPLSLRPCVLIALVDLFDFAGSVLPELDSIAGPNNPVLVAANKIDLLPKLMGKVRAEDWVRRELEYMKVGCLANVGGAVRMVSCKTGYGIEGLLDTARKLAMDMGGDVYVVGAANAGKSTLINQILEKSGGGGGVRGEGGDGKEKRRAGNANKRRGTVTTSPLPGTTLEFIKVEFNEKGGRNKKGSAKSSGDEHEPCLYDTPGLLIPGTITQFLTPEELKMVVPKKSIEPVTFRVPSGKCVLVGGLATIEIIGAETKPFLLTFYVSNDIKLHPTDSSRADAFRAKHLGTVMLSPPLPTAATTSSSDGATTPSTRDLGPFTYHEVEIKGAGWKEAGADISIRGLGWIAVTGAGTAKVKIGVPKGVGVSVRPPLMPYDIWESTAKYTGGKATRKAGKTRYGKKKRKGVGRR